MNNKFYIRDVLIVVLLLLFSVPAYAGWRQQDGNQQLKKEDPRQLEQKSSTGFRADTRSAPQYQTKPGYKIDNSNFRQSQKKPVFQLDKHHDHRRYYPVQGSWVAALPPGYRSVSWHGTSYYFSTGSWYLSSHGGYYVALPPIGLLVPFLPSFYTTIWVGAVPYYYAGGVYYVWEPQQKAYRITDLPAQDVVAEQSLLPRRLFIYPLQGQSEQLQASDRYECHQWAKSQADFDPTLPVADIPAAEISRRGEDYNRAMKACLVARGYSVE